MGNSKSKRVAASFPKTELNEKDLKFFSAQTHKSIDEIKDIFNRFMTNNSDGKLSKSEFSTLYISFRKESPELLEQITDYVFKAFDTNKNGSIDFYEFIIGYSITSASNLAAKLNYIFDLYDLNDNGVIEREDLISVFSHVQNLTDPEEKIDDVALFAEVIWNDMDKNHDGKVVKSEFTRALLQNDLLVKILSPFN
ncbi:unnamed protein product [Brachionus calyciflorus]|uniref:EF-hand domain-containing protein n=1 Tax=Brachionus calyciflorus TaxID=104777 RepID=A0A814KP05_9BILA|nr:unnamed protein product [Brachionus calyciflorus]